MPLSLATRPYKNREYLLHSFIFLIIIAEISPKAFYTYNWEIKCVILYYYKEIISSRLDG